MAQRIFNFTTPADTVYRSLWGYIQGIASLKDTIPSSVCDLKIYNGSVALSIADANYANCTGISVAASTQFIISIGSGRNLIDLQNIFIMANAGAVQGLVIWT
jgi:hypothetical protein